MNLLLLATAKAIITKLNRYLRKIKGEENIEKKRVYVYHIQIFYRVFLNRRTNFNELFNTLLARNFYDKLNIKTKYSLFSLKKNINNTYYMKSTTFK